MDGQTASPIRQSGLTGQPGQTFEQVSASKLTVVVLAGGPSAEREVSLASGQVVARALANQGHAARTADIGPDDWSVLDDDFDVVFPALHGTFGEDGQLQRALEQRGIVYAGSDSASSALAMDKYAAKQQFFKAGLMTPEAVLIKADGVLAAQPAIQNVGQAASKTTSQTARSVARQVEQAIRQVGLPCVVKPNSQGSSIGVVLADDAATARQAVAETIARYGDCLIEQLIVGRELTVGILGSRALPVLEVRTERCFYDYQAKYADDRTEYFFDIDLSADQLRGVQADAQRAFGALRCRDFGRVDMILDAAGGDYILEVNTIPGFTDHSLLPKAAGRVGLSMAQMCDQIVRMAQARSIQ